MVDHTFIFFADLCEIYCHITQLRDSWRGWTEFFILHLKSLSCAGNYGAQNSRATLVKFHPIQNVATWKTAKDQPESQTGKPHHQSKLYREKQALHVFWMKWVLQKAVKRSLDNSIQRRKCLQDRKFYGGKRWNIKKNSEKLSFIGKWPNYSPSTNLSTQNSIVRLCINWNFFFDLLFTRHYNDLKELVWISKISSDSHHNYNQSSNELEHNLLIVKFSKNACKTHSTLLFKLNLPNCSIF